MKKSLLVIIILATSLIGIPATSLIGQTEQILTDNTGKKIRILADGKWEYVIEKPVSSEPSKGIVADDRQALAALLTKHRDQLKKSEFETESEFSKRLKEFLASVTNPVSGKSLSEATVIIDGADNYNAETQTFSFSYGAYRIKQIGIEEKVDFDFVERRSSYWFSFTSMWMGAGLRFKIEPKKASEIKADLAIAVIGWPVNIDHGYIASESSSHTISIAPRRYIVFNKKTGEVYVRIEEPKTIF